MESNIKRSLDIKGNELNAEMDSVSAAQMKCLVLGGMLQRMDFSRKHGILFGYVTTLEWDTVQAALRLMTENTQRMIAASGPLRAEDDDG